MKLAQRILPLLLFAVLLLHLVEARGGGRGGGGSRGGGRGIGRGGYGGGGRRGSGGFKTFGSAKRWSFVGGRRLYYVGYYRHGSYHGKTAGSSGGGLTAAGLVVLLLALIGSGVGLYYAYICLQARPLRPKKHRDAEHGPLISPDPDVNGNHEDVPVEASAPSDEDANIDVKPGLDEPDHAPVSPDSKEEDSPKPPKDKEDVLISVEDDVPPVKVTHERETAPATTQAPLGFVVPTSSPAAEEAPLDHHPQPINILPQPQTQPQPQPQPQPQVQPEPPKIKPPPSSKAAPVPVYIPPPQQKKPIAISDEEDGLLLQEPAPQDDSLNSDLCATLPVSRSPQQPVPRDVTPQTAPPASPPQPEAQPVVVVIPNMASGGPEKEEMKPVGKAPDPLPSENCDRPAPLYMKEEDEHLPTAPPSEEPCNTTPTPAAEPVPEPEPMPVTEPEPIPDPKPVPTSELVPAEPVPIESVSEEPKEPINKDISVDSDDSFPTEAQPDCVKATPELLEDTEAAKIPPEDDKTKSPPENAKVPEEEARPDSPSTVPSEEPDHPCPEPAISEVVAHPVASPREGSEDIVTEEAVPNAIPVLPPAVPEPCDSPVPVTAKEHLPHTTEEELCPNVIVHSSAEEEDALSEASSDTSEEVCDNTDIPAEAPVIPEAATHPEKEVSAPPAQPPAVVPTDVASVPMEAFTSTPDDYSDEEDSALPAIREEGSADNNSEGTDTESSEPEVTEYSFSSGPSAPSTTGVLANEVSCTLEPKVTKFMPIDDLDDSEFEGSEISDEDIEERDIKTPSESEEETVTPSVPVENKSVEAEKPPSAAEEHNTVTENFDSPKENTTPDVKPDVFPNGPAASESPVSTPEAADKLPEEEEDSDMSESETESEGAEAEMELKEEMVSVPVVCNNTSNHIAESPVPPTANHNDSPSETCNPKAQLLKTPQGNGSSLEEIPKVTDEGDGLSVSPSESCDLSDGEVTTSTPKKSLIPRLMKQSEA